MKRLVDFCWAAMGLVVLAPIFLLVALAIKLTSHGPVFFRQVRLGRHGSRFRIYKFRTMHADRVNRGNLVTAANDHRITALGRFLRRSKVDELPQIINVLRGDMSFVGPRPEVPEFAEMFAAEYERILQVKPGITHAATMRFRREEEILSMAPDPRRFYLNEIMPRKLADYEATPAQGLFADVATIIQTVMPFMGAEPYGPAHFGLGQARQVEPAVTLVENIPVYGTNATPTAPAERIRARAV